ncbi:MAG TPA: AraC family transcriptional regulator [Syntrophomonadaceae bacterium]|nr:AraC family transcriptional regulator [Syntrophomonadaceae bacterium]
MMARRKRTIKFIETGSIRDLQIVAGKDVMNIFPMHIHEKFCMGTIAKGQAILECKNSTFPLSVENLYFLNAGEAHQIKPSDEEGFDHVVFCFGYEFLKNYFGPNKTAGFRFNTAVVYNHSLGQRFIDFYRLVINKDAEMNLEYELLDLLAEIYEFCSFTECQIDGNKTSLEIITMACAFIKENCYKNLSLDELAAYAALSKFHFSRVFKEVMWISPYEFQIQARIKLARDMLLNKESIADVALTLGFNDQSHFSRFFKRDTGLTPAEYTKMNIKV